MICRWSRRDIDLLSINEEALRIARKHRGVSSVLQHRYRMNGNSYRTNLLEVMLHYRDKNRGSRGLRQLAFPHSKVQFVANAGVRITGFVPHSPFEGIRTAVDDATYLV